MSTAAEALPFARDYAGIAHRYARDVVSGKVLACKYVKQACQRHLNDLKRARQGWLYRFDPWHAGDVCDFIEKLPHVDGVWDSDTITLEAPQIFILAVAFGWRRAADGGRRFSYAYIEVARKAGKAEWIENLIPTPSGFRRMGDLEPGDFVFGGDGQPIPVRAVTEVMYDLDCMSVTFATGESVIVAAAHEWRVNQRVLAENRNRSWGSDEDDTLAAAYPGGGINAAADALPHRSRHALYARANSLGLGTDGRHFRSVARLHEPRQLAMPPLEPVLETRQLAAAVTYGKRQDRRFSVDVAPAIDLPATDLLVPPYTLGAWLGDGHSASACLTVAYLDGEIVDAIRAEGVTVEERSSSNSNSGLYRIGRGGRRASLQAKLRVLGVLGDKHIPKPYLRSAASQRLSLLRGLMDTDGTISPRGECSFVSVRRRLAEDVRELVASLGMKATLLTKPAILNGRVICDSYVVRFYPPADQIVFCLTRKAIRQCRRAKGTRSDTRSIVAVDAVPSVPVRCIEVDADDGIYLTGRSFIPTHNSSLSAGVALYCLCCDDEPGAQIIIGATTGEQAGKVFLPAKAMVDQTADLREEFGLAGYAKSIARLAGTGGYIQTINAKGKTQDGWNPHLSILDELHAHPNRALFDVIKSARGARKNRLLWIITTAGFNTNGVCYEQRTYVAKVLAGIIEAEHVFAIIFTLDEGDPTFDERVWPKANPLIGITPSWDDLRQEALDAKASPSAEGNFKTKHLNIWQNALDAWLPMERWLECGDPTLDWKDFEGLDCWIGGDLADKDDIVALVLAAFDADDVLLWKPMFWLPEAVLKMPEHLEGRGVAPYRLWRDQGHLQVTEGDWVDHNVVEAQVRAWIEDLRVRKATFDQFAAAQAMASRINEDLGTPDDPIAQILHKKASNVTDPAKELEARVKAGPARFRHDGNPVMNWMASNAVVARRRDETILPIKESPMSPNKIDGIDAGINAIAPAVMHLSEPEPDYQILIM